ncbi:putative iron-regulated membrane protein [Neolewinella xylanilytica]|uniref:Putative iron-regulated membrane protein n=1 Tax=Neolewinella xylanilytica TaxID=1514080 RepID=A0A2S6I6Y0_9BACT|nr:PepSY-associated TM helix domain-containing protein [Neolewinella xylanilytica]PPK87253.1 putative iron-regulated membrane protein [Neolewinella xylanilytica]
MKRTSKRFRLLLAVHKYLGLATGIIVLLVSLTGAAWVFKEEIEPLYEPEFVFEPAAEAELLSASRARELGQAVFPEHAIHGTLFEGTTAPVEVIFYQVEPRFYQSVFLHPTTGEILHTKDHLSGFFAWALLGHMYLWLPMDVGSMIVKYGILVFLFIIVSGLLIWLPGRVKRLRKNLSFRWKPTTGWRRKNFDLHSIVGVYIYVFAFLFAFTGSVIGLPWFYYATYKVLGGSGDPSFVIPENVSAGRTAAADDAAIPYDRLVPRLMREEPDARSFELHYPYSETSSVYVEIERGEGTFYRNDYRYFDQYTLEEIPSPGVYAKYADADFAKFVMRLNYDVHIGAIGGIPGKVIAFLASLVIASLPVTGFVMWYGRRKKGKKRPPAAVRPTTYAEEEPIKRDKLAKEEYRV